MNHLFLDEQAFPQPPLAVRQDVERAVQQKLDDCPYSFMFSKVTAAFDNERLTLRGTVPSFYLKQTLQELLRGIEHVGKIENEVDVVCCDGLSSVRTAKPK
jgi:hypothetical protein